MDGTGNLGALDLRRVGVCDLSWLPFSLLGVTRAVESDSRQSLAVSEDAICKRLRPGRLQWGAKSPQGLK